MLLSDLFVFVKVDYFFVKKKILINFVSEFFWIDEENNIKKMNIMYSYKISKVCKFMFIKVF